MMSRKRKEHREVNTGALSEKGECVRAYSRSGIGKESVD